MWPKFAEKKTQLILFDNCDCEKSLLMCLLLERNMSNIDLMLNCFPVIFIYPFNWTYYSVPRDVVEWVNLRSFLPYVLNEMPLQDHEVKPLFVNIKGLPLQWPTQTKDENEEILT